MQYKAAALFAVGVTATGWLDQSAYSCPSNTDNKCSDSQAGGYDWSGLDTGSFNNYGSNSFSGFSCGNSYGKRDLLTKRTFQSKCIQGDLYSNPSMSCDQDDDRMSIDEMQISSSHDADVECHYDMPDGSTCRETHSCSSGGSIVKNSQCGGARSVTFKPGKNAPSGCSIGVHSIGFNCNSASSSVPIPTSSVVISTSSAPAPSCAYGDEGCSSATSTSETIATPGYTSRCHGQDCTSSATPSSPISTSSAPVPSCAYGDEDCSATSSTSDTIMTPGTTYRCHGADCSTSSTPSSPASTSSPVETSSCAYGDESCSSTSSSDVPSSPASSSAPAPSCAYGEEGCESATTGVPGYTQRTSSTENSPVGTTSSSLPPYPTSSTKSESIPIYGTGSVPSSTPISPVSSSSVPNYPEPSCPGVLPRCLKTWLHVSACKDSSDSDCFCKDATFIKNVHECLPAWADDEEASAAASYLMGLCAPAIPENPGIITNCPSSITPVATPTHTKPATSGTEGSPVESEAPDYTPKEHTSWSTAVVTITSCGPEVTNCPASSTVVQTTSTAIVSIETTVSVETTPASTPYSPITTSAGSPPEYAPTSDSPSAPGQTAPPAPCTTVTFSSSVVAPATYTEGVSQGYEIPDSSYTTQLVTTITVPQVAMTTVTVTENGQETTSVGLGAGSPAPAPAYPTADAVQPPPAYGTGSAGWGTSYVPKPTQSMPVQQVGNSGSKVGTSFAGLAVGAVAVVMAL